MNFESVVSNGQIVVEVGNSIPDGEAVRVTVSRAVPLESAPVPAVSDLGRRLMRLAGIANDLPADMADQHDHYLHGRPKQ